MLFALNSLLHFYCTLMCIAAISDMAMHKSKRQYTRLNQHHFIIGETFYLLIVIQDWPPHPSGA